MKKINIILYYTFSAVLLIFQAKVYSQEKLDLEYNSSIKLYDNSINTKYGLVKFTPNHITKDNEVRILALHKSENQVDTIWTSSKNSFHQEIGAIRGFYLNDNYCSFTYTSSFGREMIVCKKEENGQWKEKLRKFFLVETKHLNNIINITLIGSHTIKVKYRKGTFKEAIYHFDEHTHEILFFQKEKIVEIPFNNWNKN